MDEWDDFNNIINIAKKESKKIKRTNYKRCVYCLKDITKTNFSKHILRKHFKYVNSYKKKLEIASKVFINNTKKIINNLEEIQELLIESRRIKIKKSKNLEKRKWFIRYKDNIMELINLLQGKGNKNDEEEGDDNMDDENDNQ